MCQVLIGAGGALPFGSSPARLDPGGEWPRTGQLVYSFKRDFIANSSKHRKTHTQTDTADVKVRNVMLIALPTKCSCSHTPHTPHTPYTPYTLNTQNNQGKNGEEKKEEEGRVVGVWLWL